MAWTGDNSNPVPNIGNIKSDLSQAIAQNSSNLSEKNVEVNRAEQTKRDNDVQKDNTVKLIDIDTAIMKQLEKIQLKDVDNGKSINVPYYFASPEKWKSIQVDGIIRDYNGKIILPAIVLQRTTSTKDQAMMMFNRYLTYPVLKRYSDKNRYTKFSILSNRNTPINDVFDVVMPKHMVFTYHFIVWTELNEQMNDIIERFNFETEDYWGDVRGLRFRTKIEDFQHATELQVDQDRLVKTEFDLVVNGYSLPDQITKMKGKSDTTKKWLTPKKVIITSEVVSDSFNMDSLDNNDEKWRNQNYPNLPKSAKIGSPPISLVHIQQLTQQLNQITNGIGNFVFPSPGTSSSPGQEGNVSYDSDYYYIYTDGKWKRVPIALFNDMTEF